MLFCWHSDKLTVISKFVAKELKYFFFKKNLSLLEKKTAKRLMSQNDENKSNMEYF